MVLQLDAKDVGDVVAIVDDDAFWHELGEVEKAAVRPSAVAMMKAGSDATVDSLTIATGPAFFKGVDAAIKTNADNYLDDWWSALEKTDRNQLRTSLQRFANEQTKGGFPAMRKEVEGIFGKARGRMIAETETTRLWALGTDTTLAEAGVDEYEWRTVRDPLVDELCAERNGKRYKVGSGILPPLHPRCRCAIIGVPQVIEPQPELEPEPPAEERRRTDWDEKKQALGDRFVKDGEYGAITLYKQDSRLFNGPLRGTGKDIFTGVGKTSLDDHLKAMDSLLRDATLFEDTTVFRGVSMERETVDRLVSKGGSLRDPGYQSFTTQSDRAANYALKPNVPAELLPSDPVPVVMRMEAKQGSRVLELQDLNPNDLEGEHIIARNLRLDITSSRTVVSETGEYVEFTVEF